MPGIDRPEKVPAHLERFGDAPAVVAARTCFGDEAVVVEQDTVLVVSAAACFVAAPGHEALDVPEPSARSGRHHCVV